jgi:MFS transporter, OFA family, oxalate/formate antiporter
MSESSDYN